MRIAAAFWGCILAVASADAAQLQTLDRELDRIGTATALVMPAQDIQESPLWSPASDFIAVNVLGNWQKINLAEIALKPTAWRGSQRIGVINSSSISGASREEISAWRKVSRMNPSRVTTKGGMKIELKLDEMGMSTSLIVSRKGEKPSLLWVAEAEHCHSLVLSPDERYVAFVSPMNGMVVMKLDDLR